MENTKVVIAGGRDFSDYNLLCKKCDFYLSNKNNIKILCGCAKGADLLGKRYAEERGYPVDEYPADWNLYGKSAGFVRNKKMIKDADFLIAFWDGKSHGTKDAIETAKDFGIQFRIVQY